MSKLKICSGSDPLLCSDRLSHSDRLLFVQTTLFTLILFKPIPMLKKTI
jgi:hypothetical protein